MSSYVLGINGVLYELHVKIFVTILYMTNSSKRHSKHDNK